MPYNFVADGFHTKNFVADMLPEKCNYRWKTTRFVFLSLPWGA